MSKDQWVRENLKEGEHYAGIVLGKDGKPDHHLVLISVKNERLTWDAATAWASHLGGSIPTCNERAILHGNVGHKLESGWYWSCDQGGDNNSGAYMTDSAGGNRSFNHKSYEYKVCAVRRLTIE